MSYLKILCLTFILACVGEPGTHRRKRLKNDQRHVRGNFQLEEIEAEAQKAMNEASELLKFEATRKDHPMVIAKKFDLRYDPEQMEGVNDQANKFKNGGEQVEKGTDGHLEFELQKHKGVNKHLYYNVPDKAESDKDNYHLFYDVNVKSQKVTLPPPTRKTPPSQKSLTLEKALPLLEKIAQEIITEDKDSSRNDAPCPIDGQWISKVGGIKLKLNTMVNGKINVNTSKTDVPHVGELQGCAWHISGLVPSRREGPFALAAICSPQHRIATFIGQCKVCSDVETIYGNWMFSRISRDCNEAMAAIDIKSDIWLRDRLQDIRSSEQKKRGGG